MCQEYLVSSNWIRHNANTMREPVTMPEYPEDDQQADLVAERIETAREVMRGLIEWMLEPLSAPDIHDPREHMRRVGLRVVAMRRVLYPQGGDVVGLSLEAGTSKQAAHKVMSRCRRHFGLGRKCLVEKVI